MRLSTREHLNGNYSILHGITSTYWVGRAVVVTKLVDEELTNY